MTETSEKPLVTVLSTNSDRSANGDDASNTCDDQDAPFTGAFFDKNAEASKARATFLRVHLSGLLLVSLVIFTVFPIFWGALWKLPAHTVKGWVVVRLVCIRTSSGCTHTIYAQGFRRWADRSDGVTSIHLSRRPRFLSFMGSTAAE